MGQGWTGADLLLLVGASDASRTLPAEMAGGDGPWPRRLHQGLRKCLGRALPGDARAQDGLRRQYPSLVSGLGSPPDAVGFGRRFPGREADAGSLADPSVVLGDVG